jgi:hypothetical protein
LCLLPARSTTQDDEIESFIETFAADRRAAHGTGGASGGGTREGATLQPAGAEITATGMGGGSGTADALLLGAPFRTTI